MAAKFFFEIDTEQLAGATVIVDVDGTLVPDGEHELDPRAADTLRRLGQHSAVYLCSNATASDRVQKLAQAHGVSALVNAYRKPDVRALGALVGKGHMVVIGDKHLTDGLLAKNAGASFIRVHRIRGKERLFVRATYALDGLLGRFLTRGTTVPNEA